MKEKTIIKGSKQTNNTWIIAKDINMSYWFYDSFNEIEKVKYVLNHIPNTYVFNINEVILEK